MADAQSHPQAPESSAAVQLNHTVVHATDRRLSAEFIAAVLGLEVGPPSGRSCPSTWATA